MFTVFGFYKLKKIKFLKKNKSLFQKEISKNNVKGTIILSAEGINGTIAGKKNNITKIPITPNEELRQWIIRATLFPYEWHTKDLIELSTLLPLTKDHMYKFMEDNISNYFM